VTLSKVIRLTSVAVTGKTYSPVLLPSVISITSVAVTRMGLIHPCHKHSVSLLSCIRQTGGLLPARCVPYKDDRMGAV
jgi:hypothetical protein